jgi:hypothetical protein
MGDDLEEMTIAELRDLAEERGVEVPAGPKQAIIDALTASEVPVEDEPESEPEPAQEPVQEPKGFGGLPLSARRWKRRSKGE